MPSVMLLHPEHVENLHEVGASGDGAVFFEVREKLESFWLHRR